MRKILWWTMNKIGLFRAMHARHAALVETELELLSLGRKLKRSEMHERLLAVSDSVADVRGIENIRLVHSILFEATRYCEAKFDIGIYEEIINSDDPLRMDLSGREYAFTSLSYRFMENIFHGIDPLDSTLNMQGELPSSVWETLENCGLTEEEIYSIFCDGIERVDKNDLPPIYRNNAHVIKEGYQIK